MRTPICDFVRKYADSDTLRLHMPGHKGEPLTGFERLDLTEIDGADSLYEAEGIIAESEKNAGELFGADTFFSTEGSSLSIRAMLYLLMLHTGGRMRILAGRNAHKTFLSAAALLDLDVDWLYGGESYLACAIDAESLERTLAAVHYDAVYITAPDYLGNTADIAAIADACHRHGARLLVDNAHGAYLNFLPESRHPMALGADICCDSAHKTLPALTGAAYLHLSRRLPASFRENAKRAMALFGSTSPSYLILQSLDAVNAYLADGYSERLAEFAARMEQTRDFLRGRGFSLVGDEPLKLTVKTKSYGYTGTELAEILRSNAIECEFADPDHLVLMATPETGHAGLSRLETALSAVERRAEIADAPPKLSQPARVMSIREAMLSPAEIVPARESAGRILAAATVGCPPAVPIVVSGERIGTDAVECFGYFGIDSCVVIK